VSLEQNESDHAVNERFERPYIKKKVFQNRGTRKIDDELMTSIYKKKSITCRNGKHWRKKWTS
jgi:hypothetical protein